MIDYTGLNMLKTIHTPRDIRNLNDEQLCTLAQEMRRLLISTVSVTGGHLASNLGVVELTIALHRVFDFEDDRLVLDVGHQSYVHKLLTGRADSFDTLRSKGGIAGFPKTEESPYDAFNTGHSSTSLSAAIGILRGDVIVGRKRHVVAVIGDGALTGGMAYEALDDIGQSEMPLIIVLNDNKMSISHNVGGMSRHLMKLRSSNKYVGFKRRFSGMLRRIPRVGKRISDTIERLKNRIKYFVLPNVLFEELGITYLGPVDGHDIKRMTEVFESVKNTVKPVLVHVITRKGAGYKPAEDDPERFHSVGKFGVETGETSSSESNSDIFADELCKIAEDRLDVAAITAAMTSGTGLYEFKRRFPERFFDVGIAEQHAVTMAAGMAMCGTVPVFCVYSSFLQRGYDQLLHDVCLQNLKVVFGIDRAGLVGADGETHHGIYDIAYLMSLPNMTILSPSSRQELRAALRWAVYEGQGACAIRYCRGVLPDVPNDDIIDMTKWECLHPVRSISVVATGRLLTAARKACEGMDVGLFNARALRPMDEYALRRLSRAHHVITLEDGICDHGFGAAVAAWLSKNGSGASVVTLGVPNIIVESATVAQQDEFCGVTAEQIHKRIIDLMGENHANQG